MNEVGRPRTVAIMLHQTRTEAVEVAAHFLRGVNASGITCLVPPSRMEELARAVPDVELLPLTPETDGAELMVVFGGDGTILRAAEWALPQGVPLLGVNLGHVGFLAELEPSDMTSLVQQVVDGDYDIESRLTLTIEITMPGRDPWASFAINEVSLEKAAGDRMIEALVSVDGRPVSRWSCDGVLVSTPTGSTAYAFSAGGPVIWPDVEAIELVPLSAHALFARAMVLSPLSRVEVEVVRGNGLVWCDGRRTLSTEPGSCITVSRGGRDMLIARLKEQPFATRLVKKFDLPVDGWRFRDAGN